jgi:hypothetical protein
MASYPPQTVKVGYANASQWVGTLAASNGKEPSDRSESLPPMPPLGSDPRCYPAGGRGQTVPEAVIGGAGAWRPFLLRRRNVPLTGEKGEVLRLHVPQTLGLPRRLVRTVSLAEASSKARAGHLGVVGAAAPTTPLSSAPQAHDGAVRTARRR